MADPSSISNAGKLATFLGSGGIAGLVVALVGFLMSWIRDHDAVETYNKQLNRLNTRTVFWKTWLEAQQAAKPSDQELAKSTETAVEELNRLSEVMSQLVTSTYSKLDHPIGWLRWLFVLYLPERGSFMVWASRFWFYSIYFDLLYGLWDPSVERKMLQIFKSDFGYGTDSGYLLFAALLVNLLLWRYFVYSSEKEAIELKGRRQILAI
jgi:hypothetical protein